MMVGTNPLAAPDRLGFVSLVGAGPGDPELLTLKAARRLAEADLLLYDGLVPAAITALATRAQHFSVSKRAGRPSVDQETIHQVMIRGARRGKRVVRLKNGDPFLLGRGGEEALALRAAGIPFEVVPGITAAVAAPALAGIPVTHRGLAAGFTVVSGHAAEAFEPILGAVTPESMTVIILMGLRNRARIAAILLERGWRADTPAACRAGRIHPTDAPLDRTSRAARDRPPRRPARRAGHDRRRRGSEPEHSGRRNAGPGAHCRCGRAATGTAEHVIDKDR